MPGLFLHRAFRLQMKLQSNAPILASEKSVSVNRAQILRLMQNTQRTFQLATRLKRHGNTFAPKPNKPAVLPHKAMDIIEIQEAGRSGRTRSL